MNQSNPPRAFDASAHTSRSEWDRSDQPQDPPVSLTPWTQSDKIAGG